MVPRKMRHYIINFAVSPSGKPPRTGYADMRSWQTREVYAVAL